MTDELIQGRDFMQLHGGPWKRQGGWMVAFCPAHADGSKHNGEAGQSLIVSVERGVVECKAGCSFKEIMEAVRERAGVPLQHNREPEYGAFPDPALPAPTPIRRRGADHLVEIYKYADADGVVVGEKARFEDDAGGKRFMWRLPGVDGWPGGDSGCKMPAMPLYHLPALLARPTEDVYVVEGEKALKACEEHGLLTTCSAGGGAQRDFGDSLEPLRGRRVHLWADNDGPGAAYMAHLRAQLQLMGCQLFAVQVSLGPKEDAADYFARGGSVDALTSVDPSQPIVQLLAEDSVKIVVVSDGGVVTFLFEDMEKRRRELSCSLTVTTFNNPDPYVERINMESNSATTQLRRDLEAVYGKEFNWVKLMNKVFGLAREAYLSQERGTDVFDLPDSIGEVFLVDPLIVASGPTIFFGDGASLKSYITGLLSVCMAFGIRFCGMAVPRLTVLYIDWEDEGPNWKRRMQRMADGLGVGVVVGVHYWNAGGIPLADQADALKRYILKHGIGLLVLDSVAPACGGDPSDHKEVMHFFGALKSLGLPSVLIAHVTKALEVTKPFGSAYWHNEARRTWYVMRATEEDSDEVDVGFYNKKVNDGRVPKPIAFHVSFDPDIRGPVEVKLQPMDRAAAALHEQLSDKSRVWECLTIPSTAAEVASETGIGLKTVQHLFGRNPNLFMQAGTRPVTTGRPPVLWARRAPLGLYPTGENSGEKGENSQGQLYN